MNSINYKKLSSFVVTPKQKLMLDTFWGGIIVCSFIKDNISLNNCNNSFDLVVKWAKSTKAFHSFEPEVSLTLVILWGNYFVQEFLLLKIKIPSFKSRNF